MLKQIKALDILNQLIKAHQDLLIYNNMGELKRTILIVNNQL